MFIHPTTRGFDVPVLNEFYLWNAVGNPFETTLTAAHMTMAGVMERHRDLRVLLAHGGGALPALRGRLAHAHSFQPQAHAGLKESPLESIRASSSTPSRTTPSFCVTSSPMLGPPSCDGTTTRLTW